MLINVAIPQKYQIILETKCQQIIQDTGFHPLRLVTEVMVVFYSCRVFMIPSFGPHIKKIQTLNMCLTFHLK